MGAVINAILGSGGASTADANTWDDVQTFDAQVQWSKGNDVASATALPILTDGNYFDVTGTTTITSIATTGHVGTVIRLHFDGILLLTHSATDLVLPGAANITTAAGDEATFVEYASGDFRCTVYTKASGEAVVSGGAAGLVLLATKTASTSASLEFTTGIDSTYAEYLFVLELIGSTSSADSILVTLSANAGSSWASTNYEYHTSTVESGVTGYSAVAGTSTTHMQICKAAIPPNDALKGVSGEVRIFSPSISARPKLSWQTVLSDDTGADIVIGTGGGGQWTNLLTNGVKFAMATGSIFSGKIRMYGVIAA